MSTPRTDRNSLPIDANATPKIKALMVDMGGTGWFDPESREQNEYVLEHGAPDDQFVAQLKALTTHKDGERTPYAVDPKTGKAVYFEGFAKLLGWTLEYTKNIAYKVQLQGRCRIKKGTSIWGVADVNRAAKQAQEGRTEGEKNTFCTKRWPTYLLAKTQNWPSEMVESLIKEEEEIERLENAAIAEATGIIRDTFDRAKDNMWARRGVELKRHEDKRREDSGIVQLTFHGLPDFVQNEAAAPYKTKNGGVQNGASYMYSDSESEGQTSARPSASPSSFKPPAASKQASSVSSEAVEKKETARSLAGQDAEQFLETKAYLEQISAAVPNFPLANAAETLAIAKARGDVPVGLLLERIPMEKIRAAKWRNAFAWLGDVIRKEGTPENVALYNAKRQTDPTAEVTITYKDALLYRSHPQQLQMKTPEFQARVKAILKAGPPKSEAQHG